MSLFDVRCRTCGSVHIISSAEGGLMLPLMCGQCNQPMAGNYDITRQHEFGGESSPEETGPQEPAPPAERPPLEIPGLLLASAEQPPGWLEELIGVDPGAPTDDLMPLLIERGAYRHAVAHALDVCLLAGSGPAGLITLADVLAEFPDTRPE